MIFIIQLAGIFLVSIHLVHSKPPPPPPPGESGSQYIISNPYTAFCPNESFGFLNDSCDDDHHPCFNDYSIQCVNGVCLCRHDYIPSSLHNGLCDSAPYLNQPCDSACRVPLVCTSDTPTTTPYPTPYPTPPYSTSPNLETETSGSGSSTTSAYATDTSSPSNGQPISTTETAPAQPTPPKKTCQCVPPYYLQYGYNCILAMPQQNERTVRANGLVSKLVRCLFGPRSVCTFTDCPSDEYYDSNDGKCKPRCESDQVKLANGYCAPVAKLGESCYDNLQCTQENSVCTDGVCECEPGFTSEPEQSNTTKGKGKGKNGGNGAIQCVPEEYTCPWSSPLKQNGKVMECNTTNVYYPSYQVKSCPDNAYCLTTPTSAYYQNYVQYGFCCPKPKLACPVGKPLLSAKCPYGPSYPPSNVCPYQTHYCYTITVGDGAYSQSLCCPLTCERNFVLVNGTCYQLVQNGDECAVNEQCGQFNGACINGTCGCPPNSYSYYYSPSYCYPYFYCQDDQVQINNQCYKRRKLGEYCGDAPGNVCPYNAACDPDQGETCQCECTYIPIGNSRCEHYPVCRRGYYYYSYPYYPQYQDYDSTPSPNCTDQSCSTLAPTSTPSPPPPAPQGNFTFCAVNGVEPPVAVAEECPEGQFCNNYIYDLGLCCPIPEPICPNGARSNQSCDPNNYYSCPNYQYCHQSYSSVGNEPAAGYICCEYDYYYYYSFGYRYGYPYGYHGFTYGYPYMKGG